MKTMTVVLLAFLMITPYAFAVEYKVNVVQKGGNLYWAETEKMYIQTEYCFEGAETAVLLLRMTGDIGEEVTFTESGHKCDVKMLYGQTQLNAGEYALTVSREDDNWYVMDGKDVALNTNGCLSLVENMVARLQINEDGTGTLSLPDADEECTVEGIYSKAKLEIAQ
ncbi:MAG: hypothetical protein QNK24_09305 [Desulfuromusa sp.]|nr:hypothetical protein [Desulfuromusa sp.]